MGTRLTATDASFLYLETASTPMHISSLHVLDGEVDFTVIFQHFADRIHLVPAYRRKVAFVPFNLAHPTWEDDPDFDLTRHVKHHELPANTSMEKALDFRPAMDTIRSPACRPLRAAAPSFPTSVTRISRSPSASLPVAESTPRGNSWKVLFFPSSLKRGW